MKITGLFYQEWMRHLMRVVALFVVLGFGVAPAVAAPDTDSKNICKMPYAFGSASTDANQKMIWSGANQKIIKALGKCEEGLYEGQLIYGSKGINIFVGAGTVERSEFRGVHISIHYHNNGESGSISIFEGNSGPVNFSHDTDGLKKAVKEIYRLTDMGGDNHNPANRELLLNVINKHIQDQHAFYNEFIKGTGSTGIAINAPFTPTPTPVAELPDDPLVFGRSASPNSTKTKGKKKK